ncbi:hypothetical protein ACFUC1_03640 [Pedococcus sp. NPDC057267]|uniref:hypothetical protein n=1 Tax=Pedococcus sp. NPDC057267 TaxID=3346077 RepID=UPI003635042D
MRGNRVGAALAAACLALSGCSGSRPAPHPPASTRPATTTQQDSAQPSVAREEALSALLARRAAAVRDRDRTAFAATLASTTSGFGLRQLAQLDALDQLPIGRFEYGTPEAAPALGPDRLAQLGPDAWVARVEGRYSLKGYDTATRGFESYFTVVRRDGRWLLADDTDGGTQAQLWDLPDFTVVEGDGALVLGSGPASRLRPYLALGEHAVAQVRDVWTGSTWNGRLVLVVPRTAAEMADLVGQQAGSVAQVAAVTDGPFDATGRAGADRVVVNPTAFAGLQRRGQQVVVTHEATHVAIRATTTRPVPLWLSEGMADYVGYRDVDATEQQVAAALFAEVRAGRGPTALPRAEEFDPAHTTIGPTYNAAWLAVRQVAERYGTATLVRFYRAAASAPSADASASEVDAATARAFQDVLHTTVAAFTRQWLASIRAAASAG